VTLCPTSISRCAMAAPILPMPAIPICMQLSPRLLQYSDLAITSCDP
jgi:hypothetical protein